MNVYLVMEDYEYDRPRVMGIFSTRELAESYAAKCRAKLESEIRAADGYSVEECIVDSLVDHEIGPIFTARIGLVDGAVTTWDPVKDLRHPGEVVINESVDDAPPAVAWIIVRSPISEAHAVEVAKARRREWLRAHPQVITTDVALVGSG